MAIPNIKAYLIPNHPGHEVTSDNDIRVISGGNQAKLIERAMDGTLIDQGWLPPYETKYMLKMKPQSSGSNVYVLDIGAGASYYHNTLKSNFFGDAVDGNACNFAWNNGGTLALEEWVKNIQEFAPNSGISRPPFLKFKVFALRQSTFLGIQGESISIPFTHIPEVGGYSFNWQEDGYPVGGVSNWGDVSSVYLAYDSALGYYRWYGKVNYSVDTIAKTLTFDMDYFSSVLQNGFYSIYIQCYIVRSNNVHSLTSSGTLSNERVYYRLPHYDLVETLNYSVSTSGWSPASIVPTLLKNTGLVEYDRSLNNYPPSGQIVNVGGYSYHSWPRLTNDMCSDLMMRTYYLDGNSGERGNQIYNYENNGEENQGHFNDPAIPQTKQIYPNFSWADIKIVNEITPNPSDPPNFFNIFLDAVPRGNLSNTTIEAEEIAHGSAGLININRPYDHQEGSSSETDSICFIRPTRTFAQLINAPNVASVNIWEKCPMSKMCFGQAKRIKQWYKAWSFNGSGKRVMKLTSGESIVTTTQTGETLIMIAGDIVYARVVYMPYDGTTKTSIASSLKRFSIAIQGEYFII